MYEKLKNFFKKRFENYKEHSDEQIYVKCPFCADRRHHLGINFNLFVFHCFRCNISGKLPKLFKLLNLPIIGEKDIIHKIIEKKFLEIKKDEKKKELHEKYKKYIRQGEINNKIIGELIEFFQRKKINKEFYRDLINLIKEKKRLFGYDYFLKRFLFFSVDNIPVQGRDLKVIAKSKNFPRYITYSKNRYFEIFDLENFKNKNLINVFVVEGPFTALYWYLIFKNIKAENFYVISALGKSSILKAVKYIISKLKDSFEKINIFIILDTDAQKTFIQKILNNSAFSMINYSNINCNLFWIKENIGDSGDLLAKYKNYEEIKDFLLKNISLIPISTGLETKIVFKNLNKNNQKIQNKLYKDGRFFTFCS